MSRNRISKSLARTNNDLRRELIDLIGTMKDPRLHSGLVTVTKVETSGDLSVSKVFISVVGEGKNGADGVDPKPIMDALENGKGYIRHELAQRMRMRRMPEFIFVHDDSAAYADHINHLLREIDK